MLRVETDLATKCRNGLDPFLYNIITPANLLFQAFSFRGPMRLEALDCVESSGNLAADSSPRQLPGSGAAQDSMSYFRRHLKPALPQAGGSYL